eukprot:3431603-Amphidinium_carterae.2
MQQFCSASVAAAALLPECANFNLSILVDNWSEVCRREFGYSSIDLFSHGRATTSHCLFSVCPIGRAFCMLGCEEHLMQVQAQGSAMSVEFLWNASFRMLIPFVLGLHYICNSKLLVEPVDFESAQQSYHGIRLEARLCHCCGRTLLDCWEGSINSLGDVKPCRLTLAPRSCSETVPKVSPDELGLLGAYFSLVVYLICAMPAIREGLYMCSW